MATRLDFVGLDMPPYATRGTLTQSFDFIEGSKVFARTINGVLEDLSVDDFRKIMSSITCDGMQGPAFDPIRPGTIITVDCAFELSYKVPVPPEGVLGEDAAHTPVTGSIRSRDGYVFYRPQLVMMILSFNFVFDENGAVVGWTMELEEV